jgi:glycosyltransferase involved in cell wall biosynthesis
MLVSGSLPPMRCGVGDYTRRLAEALSETGAAVAVVTSRSSSTVHLPFEVQPIANHWKFSEARLLFRAIRRWKPDIVHFQFPTQGYENRYMPYLLPLALRAAGLPVVETWHEYQAAFMPRYVVNSLIDAVFIVVRPRYMETMSRWFRWIMRNRMVRFVPNASSIPHVVLSNEERRTVRLRYGVGDRERLVLNFGFVYPSKGVDLLFDILDPDVDRLVIASDLDPTDEYHALILEQLHSQRWRDQSVVIGFLPSAELARLLAAADAVVLPFLGGGGGWNTSIHAVVAQGTFLLTTSVEFRGYDEASNVYYATPSGLEEMKTALKSYGGRQIRPVVDFDDEWRAIARQHLEVYETALTSSASRSPLRYTRPQ